MRNQVPLSLLAGLLLAAANASGATSGEVDAAFPADTAGSEAADETPAVVEDEQSRIVIWRPQTVRDGSLLIVEVVANDLCSEPQLKWLGRVFPTYRVGTSHQALLPVALGVRGEKQLWVRCDHTQATFMIPVVEGEYPESQLSVDPKFTKRPPRRTVEERIAIRDAMLKSAPGRLWSASFLRPAAGVDTSPFGVRRTFNGKLDSRHRGLDLNGDVGDLAKASNDGVVVLAARDFYYTGNAVFIDHGDHLYTMYFHLSRLDVAVGDHVARGQVIGAIGKTGRVTGPHLHFAVKLAGTYLDPKDLLAYQPALLLSQVAQPPAVPDLVGPVQPDAEPAVIAR